LSWRDDVIERNNLAASFAIGGAFLGTALSFAGANIGEGPGAGAVIFCGLLSTGALFALWMAVSALTRLDEAITVDRDLPAGLRCAGYLIAAGFVLGRAVAGDWHSVEETLAALVSVGWPILVLAAAAIGAEKSFRPTPQRPHAPLWSCGILPALIMVAGAFAYVLLRGPW
jgi:uncharacterized membrane protein YjfL (UPF0719 family)